MALTKNEMGCASSHGESERSQVPVSPVNKYNVNIRSKGLS